MDAFQHKTSDFNTHNIPWSWDCFNHSFWVWCLKCLVSITMSPTGRVDNSQVVPERVILPCFVKNPWVIYSGEKIWWIAGPHRAQRRYILRGKNAHAAYVYCFPFFLQSPLCTWLQQKIQWVSVHANWKLFVCSPVWMKIRKHSTLL